jgi:hypothetical protein
MRTKIGPRSAESSIRSAPAPGKTGEKIMRYAFHGKRRGTLESIDGYIDASTAIDAIDQLADEGIVGVYSVRQIIPRQKSSIILQGDLEQAVEEAAGPTAAPTIEMILTQLFAKMTTLVTEVEKILSRPAGFAPAYPARTRVSETKPLSRITEQKGSVLQDIFQSNLDLRRSIAQAPAAAQQPAPAPSTTAISTTPQPAVVQNLELAFSPAAA